MLLICCFFLILCSHCWCFFCESLSGEIAIIIIINGIPKSVTSGKKIVSESIRSKRLNVVIMTIMFHRWDKYRRNSNVSKVIS